MSVEEKVINHGCSCENPYKRCRCNSMSVEPCMWCDWWGWHGDEKACEDAQFYCAECGDELERDEICEDCYGEE